MTSTRPLVKRSEFITKNCVLASFFCKSMGNNLLYNGQNSDDFERATGPMLTSDNEEKHAILPTTLNFAVRRGKLVFIHSKHVNKIGPSKLILAVKCG